MKVNAKDLLNALNSLKEVVNDQQVAHDFRAFHFLPEEGTLKIGGSDSNTTLIEQIPYEETDNSDGSKLVLPTDKIIEVVKYAGEEIELKYSEDDELVHLLTPQSSVKLMKHFSSFDGVIDFDLVQEDEFEDTLVPEDFKTLLSSLSSVIDSSETDPAFKTIFLNGEKAIVGGETTITTALLDTNEKYTFSHKAVKHVLSALSSVEAEDVVKMKKIHNGDQILLHLGETVLALGVQDVYEPDLEILDSFETKASVFVSKESLTRGLNLVRATSEDDKINVALGEEEVELSSFYEKEQSSDKVVVEQAKILQELKFETLASDLLKFAGIIPSVGVVLMVDPESEILKVKDHKDQVVSAIGVRLV